MIVGHTPQIFNKEQNAINATCRDVEDGISKGVWRVDVGFVKVGVDQMREAYEGVK